MSAIALDLTKKIELSLEKAGVVNVPSLEVRLAIDESGSMRDEYAAGLVDAIIDKFIVAAMKFDDNKSLDVGFFSDGFRAAPNALQEDVGTYIRKKFPNRHWGGTAYAPIIELFETKQADPVSTKRLFGLGSKTSQVEGTSKYRGYCAIITDGDNQDRSDFERVLSKTSGDTFFQFIAIGTDVHPTYLKNISEKYSHVSFINVVDPYGISDQDFYDALISPKLVKWIN